MYICPTNYLSTYMKHTILSLILLAWGAQAYPQTTENVPSDATFTPPFDFPITFSGNFGEIRANHFHGGLDFKTGGTIGKPVHALAEGYISRIRVTHGSGYVLDVAYNNGYKTINRHLSAFVGDVARRVEDLQYEKESWEVEITPEPGEYPVKAGQVIALSGNTGYSFGPHLHLDMFEADTDDYIDPLPFFKKKVKDNTAPRAEGIILFPQPGRGVVDGNQKHQAFPLTPKQPITAWGLVGSAIRAYDYMDGVSNRYGVHTVILEVDSVEVFRSVVDRFSEYENRMINSWTYGQYMKSFIERKDYEYSYNDGDLYYFMDLETYDMIPISKDTLDSSFRFIKENTVCKLLSYKGNVFGIETPNFVELVVTKADPGVKGDTATNVTKPATVETGAEIKVPLFINEGDKIQIDTRTGEYLGRAKG